MEINDGMGWSEDRFGIGCGANDGGANWAG